MIKKGLKFQSFFISFFRKLQERADEKRRLAELEGKNIEDVSDSDSDHELGPPLNQQCKTNEEPMEEETDNDVPDLEKVDIESMETLVGNSIGGFSFSIPKLGIDFLTRGLVE